MWVDEWIPGLGEEEYRQNDGHTLFLAQGGKRKVKKREGG